MRRSCHFGGLWTGDRSRAGSPTKPEGGETVLTLLKSLFHPVLELTSPHASRSSTIVHVAPYPNTDWPYPRITQEPYSGADDFSSLATVSTDKAYRCLRHDLSDFQFPGMLSLL